MLNKVSTGNYNNNEINHSVENGILNSKTEIREEWRDLILQNLDQFTISQLFLLFEMLVSVNSALDLKENKDFFTSLEKATIKHLADFNKKQLVHIIWIFFQLDMKSPTDEFIKAWRLSSLKNRRYFTSMDRYYLNYLFRELEIPVQSQNL
ncbi:MAG: hypothetical protein OXC37_05100 [Bdellovibrionaceae bacterium]|nr:hypothetical protein [Pseudobdellovibrionaceae bacterium]